MPQVTQNEQNDNHTRSSGTVSSWWHTVHFSGRVIMCSVLFGLGLILVGSLLFAINMDDSTNTQNERLPSELPTTPPSNVIGPVVMGIGSFIVTVGIVMCLFETQVCRKRTGDSSPLISERLLDPGRTDSDPAPMSSTSQSHGSHRHGTRKVAASPKRSKGRHAKSHGTDRKHQKTPSPRSPPVAIETPKSFMTSSEDKFLTPPNTLNEHSGLVQSNSREAEIQTSSSLMKSFTSSGPSWNQSTEYQTPSTSFGDTSVSLENSIEDGENTHIGNIGTIESIKANIDAGFLTPVTLEEEKIQRMSAEIQNQKNDLSDVQSKVETGSNTEDHKLPNSSITPACIIDVENTVAKPIEMKSKVGDCGRNENTEDKTTAKEQFTVGSHQSILSTEKVEKNITVANDKATDDEILDGSVVAEDKQGAISKDNQKIESKNKDDFSDISEISENKSDGLTSYNNNETNEDNNKDDERGDLESSGSSDETVVSQDSVLEKNASDSISKENDEGLQMMIDGDVKLNNDKSASNATTINDSINLNTPFNVKEIEETESSTHIEGQSKDNKEIKECGELSKESIS